MLRYHTNLIQYYLLDRTDLRGKYEASQGRPAYKKLVPRRLRQGWISKPWNITLSLEGM